MPNIVNSLGKYFFDSLRFLNYKAKTCIGTRPLLRHIAFDDLLATQWVLKGIHASNFFKPDKKDPYRFSHQSLYSYAIATNNITAMQVMLEQASADQFCIAFCMTPASHSIAQSARRIEIFKQVGQKYSASQLQKFLVQVVKDKRFDMAQNLCAILSLDIMRAALRNLNHENRTEDLQVLIKIVPGGLLYAIEAGLDSAAVCTVIRQEFSSKTGYLNQPNADENTPLHLAVRHAHSADVIQALIDHAPGFDNIHAKNKAGETPLMLAHPNVRSVLFKEIGNEENIYLTDRMGNNSLHRAILHNDVKMVQQLRAHTGNEDNLLRKDAQSRNAFHLVAISRTLNTEQKQEIIAILLNGIATKEKIFQTDIYGRTPLHYAAIHGDVEIVNSFLAMTSNEDLIHKLDNARDSALKLASTDKNSAALQAIINATKEEERIFASANLDDRGNNVLYRAILNGDMEICKTLLARIKNENHILQLNIDGQHALHLVGQPLDNISRQAIVDSIINCVQSKEKLFIGDKKGRTPFFYAALYGDPWVLQLLLQMPDSEIWAHTPDCDGNTPLMIAANHNKAEAAKVILEATKDKSNIHRMNFSGISALRFAVDRHNSHIVRLIAAHTIQEKDLHKPANDDSTPLSAAIKNGDAHSTGILLQKTSNLNYLYIGPNNKSLFDVAAIAGHRQVAAMVKAHMEELRNPAPKTLPTNSPRNSAEDIDAEKFLLRINRLKETIKTGPDINIRIRGGWSIVELAIIGDCLDILKEFIALGADINGRNAYGQTPLMFAACLGKAEAVKELIQAGARLEAEKDEYTAFMLAAAHNHVSVLKELAFGGANIHAHRSQKQSSIHIAALNGAVDCMHELLYMGFDIDAQDNNGCTPLMYAANGGSYTAAAYLTKHGANIAARCHKERTPLMYAVKGKNPACIDMLYHYGADIEVTDYKDETPQTLAIKANVPDISIEWAKTGKIKVKDTVGIFGLSLNGNALVTQESISITEYKRRLNNTFFIAVHQKDLRTIFLALNNGADPLASCFMGSISSLALAVHMGDAAILGMIFLHLTKILSTQQIAQAQKDAQAQIKNYYALLGATTANSCTTDKKACIDLAESLAQRLEKGQFINVELRKILFHTTKDKKFVSSHDAFDLQLRLDAKLVEGINSGKPQVSFPTLNYNLISEQEAWQIFQELVIMNMLQQRISLSLPQDPIYGIGITVELTESLHDTLVGTVVTETDRIMKEYSTNSIYLSPEKRKQFDWRIALKTNSNDWPQLDGDKTRNISAIEQIYKDQGGMDISEMEGVEPLTYQALAEAYYTERKVESVTVGALCLDNTGATLAYNGRKIFARDKVDIFEWGKWKIKDKGVESYRNKEAPSSRHLAKTLPKIPAFAKQFALLEAVYAMAPVAQALVMSGNVPNFKKLPKMKPYQTEKTQPPIIARRPDTLTNTVRTPGQMREAWNLAKSTGNYDQISFTVFGGCVHNHGFTSSELSAQEFKKEKARLAREAQSRKNGNGGDGNDPEKLIEKIITEKKRELEQLKAIAESAQEAARASEDRSRELQEKARLALIEKNLAVLQDEERIRTAWEKSEALQALEEARKRQFYAGFNVDDFQVTFMPKGSIIWGRSGIDKHGNQTGELGDSPFYTNIDTLFNSHGNADVYFKELQVPKHTELGYRDYVRAYVLDRDMFIPAAICEKNPGLGTCKNEGGGKQFFVARYTSVLREFGNSIDLYDGMKQRER